MSVGNCRVDRGLVRFYLQFTPVRSNVVSTRERRRINPEALCCTMVSGFCEFWICRFVRSFGLNNASYREIVCFTFEVDLFPQKIAF